MIEVFNYGLGMGTGGREKREVVNGTNVLKIIFDESEDSLIGYFFHS